MKLRSLFSTLICLALLLGLAPAALAAEKDYRCSPWAAEEMAEALRLGFLPADLPEDCTQPISRRPSRTAVARRRSLRLWTARPYALR